MFSEAPEPDPGAGEEALHRALHALTPVAAPHRGLRAASLAFAAAVVLLVIAAGSLAAAGALHVSFGAKTKRHPAVTGRLSLPRGANGIAAIVDGRLSVVIRGGFGLHGQTATAVALSPHALYVAAGIGHWLVALAPSGRKAWSQPTGGKVVAISWAPDGFRIAYVVRTGRRFTLRAIYGNGRHDVLIDRSVRPVQPSWRADSLAFAYVGAGGKPVVYDVGHERHDVLSAPSPVTRLAFAPVGRTLLVATASSAFLDGKRVANGRIEAVGWFHGRPAVALETARLALVRTFGRAAEAFRVPGEVLDLTGGLVVTRTKDRVLAGWRQKSVSSVLAVRRETSVADVDIG
jgi:hypothetical protein